MPDLHRRKKGRLKGKARVLTSNSDLRSHLPAPKSRKGRTFRVRPLPAYELLLALLGNQCPELFCDTISLSLKIGRNIAMTMPPTTTPRKTISIGSIKDVSAS